MNVRIFLIALAIIGARVSHAVGFAVNQMSVSPFADTEVSTNMPINRADISYADLKFCFAGTTANDFELAFGTDVNTNGVLDAEEVESRFGWRRGRYFIENVRTWERFYGEASGSSRSLSVEIHFEVRYNSQQIRSMNVSGVNAADFGALVSNVPPAWVWRREWNLMRATRRGTEPPSDWIDYKGSHRGFAVKLR